MDSKMDRIRQDLTDYYGTAMFNGNPAAIIDLAKVERASDAELINIARKNGFEVSDDSEED